jgi:hypothetical protein
VIGTPDFDPVIVGSFDGASARRGSGWVVLDFEAMRRIGINDSDREHGQMRIEYDRATDPTTIDLVLTKEGFGVEQFNYGYAGFRDGSGRFDYRIRTATNELLTMMTAYDAAGAGRASVTYVASGGATGSFSECWSPAACLTYVRDPSNFSCGTAPCDVGAGSDYPVLCAPVPFVGQFPTPPLP